MPGAVAAGRAPMSASYRPRRLDDGAVRKWMTVAAAGLGGLLVVGMGSWALMGRKPAVVPVIEADSRPLRVKPENPGGMQFAGADDVPNGGGPSAADRMAPTAEVPAPQALRAQMGQAAMPAAPPPAAAPAPAAVATAPAVVAGPVAPGVSPLPDTPTPARGAARVAAPATAQVPAPAAVTAARPVPAGGTLVQLAALDSEAAAQAEWSRLSRRLPDLLGSRRLVVQKAERDGQAVWRVRTGGFSDVAEATGFCGKLRAKGANCTVASF